MKAELRELGVNVGLLVAGFAGALLNVRRDGHENWWATLGSLTAGTLSANYLTPVVVDLVNIKNTNTQYATAFVLGFLGLRGVEWAINKFGFRESDDK
jgi:hypothetical protein